MRKHFIEFSKAINEYLLLTFLITIPSIALAWNIFYYGEKHLGQAFLEQFPVGSRVFIFSNAFFLTLFFASIMLMVYKGKRFFPFLWGGFVGSLCHVIFFLYGKTPPIPYSFYDFFVYTGMSMLFSFLAMAVIMDSPKKENDTYEEKKEKISNQMKETFFNVKDVSSVLDEQIQDEILFVIELHQKLRHENLSVEEEHVLTRSSEQLEAIMKEYFSLNQESKGKTKETFLAILEDMKQEARDIIVKKEQEKINKINRVLTLRKEKSTY